MPEITIIHIVLLVIAALAGVVAGWIIRGNRSVQEKAAVNSGWQNQIEAQRKEHDRLVDQNKGLMEQVSQFQASHTDAKNRAKELSIVVQEAFERRDELQREIKDIRSNLEVVVNERKQLQTDIEAQSADENILRQKDERINKLNQELENWHNRLPPLIDRFRVRDQEAERAEQELAVARERIRELESAQAAGRDEETRIEPVRDPAELTDGLDASNDPADDFAVALNSEPEPEPEPEPEEESTSEPEAEFGSRDRRDNLKKIKGVGPAIEKTLNEIGIFSFQQVADMSEYDIDRVAKRLKGFHSRIYREDWIGQARALLDRAAHA